MTQPLPSSDGFDFGKLEAVPPAAGGDQFRAVIDNLSQGLVMVDRESELLYWNPAAYVMHGFAGPEESSGRLQDLPGIFEVSTLEGAVLGLDAWPLARLLRGESIGDVTLRVRRLESDWSRVFQYSGARVPYAGDRSLAFLTMNDITEQRVAQEAQMRLAAIVNSSDDAIVGTTPNGLISSWNRGAEALFGYGAAEMIGRPLAVLAPSDALSEEVNAGIGVQQFEAVRVCKDGRRIDVSVAVSPIIDGDGKVIGKSRIARDITDRKRHERELQRLNRLNAALSHVNQAITRSPERIDLFQRVCRALVEEGGFAMVWVGWHTSGNPRIVPQAAWGGHTDHLDHIAIYVDDRAEGRGPSGTAFREGRAYYCNNVFDDPQTSPWRDTYRRSGFYASAALPIRQAGSVRGVLCVYSYEPDVFQDKEMALLIQAAADISFALDSAEQAEARRQAQEVARRERIFSSALIESMPGIFYFFDERGKILRWNQNFLNVSGYSADEIANMHASEFFTAEQKERAQETIREVFVHGEGSLEGYFRCKNGSTAPYFFTGKRVVVDGIVGLVGMGMDISAQTQAETAVRKSEALNRGVLDSMLAQIAVLDRDARIIAVNDAWRRFAAGRIVDGTEPLSRTHVGSSYLDAWRSSFDVTEGDAMTVREGLQSLLRGERSSFTLEYSCRARDEKRWFLLSATPLKIEDGGAAVSHLDVTERLAMEEQLRQSHRLDAVGQLTGGVAHDFNNMLTVILGNAELLQEALERDVAQRELAEMIVGAANSAAELTKRLLAFARKQALNPMAVDGNQLIADMYPLLRRTLPANLEIELAAESDPWQALVDPAQLENALLNLCINARDAMLGGGRLRIETKNVELDEDYAAGQVDVKSGQYVLIAVSDTGCGIAPDVLRRVFEPFFTTKEKGKGTGLGLAMVYGFIKQSDGHISIHSEPGQGTTVSMYLPRTKGGSPGVRAATGVFRIIQGTETILLVEDDEQVRGFALSQLKSLGYKVLQAHNGVEAMELIERHEQIDLLFTDVVMPGGMSGRQLADAARRRRPGLKVLFTSGYDSDAIVHQGRLDHGVQLLPKPYRRRELARRIRSIFDAPC